MRLPQAAITCSKLTTETLKQGVNFEQVIPAFTAMNICKYVK